MRGLRFLTLTGAIVVLGVSPVSYASATNKPVMKRKSITVTEGSSKVLIVDNTTKAVKWKVVSGKSYISLKKRGKFSATVTAKAKGVAKVRATIGKTKINCKVTVKAKGNTEQGLKITNVPANADKGDVTALDALVKKYSGGMSGISGNVSDSIQYEWEDGKLIELHWSNSRISGEFDMSGLKHLKKVSLNGNSISRLILSDGCGITSLSIANNAGIVVDWDKLSQLEELRMGYCGYKEFPISSSDKLKILNIDGNTKMKVDFSKFKGLTALNCDNCAYTDGDVDLTGNTALEGLSFGGNAVTRLDFINSNIRLLNLTDCAALTSVNLSRFANTLEYFSLLGAGYQGYNEDVKVDVSGCSKLEQLDLSGYITGITFGGNTRLEDITVNDCFKLKELKLDDSFTGLRSLYCDYCGLNELYVPSGVEVLHCLSDNQLTVSLDGDLQPDRIEFNKDTTVVMYR